MKSAVQENRRSLPRMILGYIRRLNQSLWQEIHWRLQGRPLPAPSHIKHAILRRLARRHRAAILVETGTCYGDTLRALRPLFVELHSIELSPELHRQAVERFARDGKIRLWHGDSGEVLSEVLQHVDEPAMFWLDGHYSEGPTALGSEATPILRELALIADHRLRSSHLIVVDDARYFDGTNGYPTLAELRAAAAGLGFDRIDVANDMIVLSAASQ